MARVLLVEDEAPLSRLISWSLLDAGHEVAVVTTPEAAVERINIYIPDVIVFNTVIAQDKKDMWMARIRETLADARILDVSSEKNARASGIIGAPRDGAYRDGASRNGASRDGASRNGASADGSLGLPFPEGRLLEEIDRMLAVERTHA